MIGAVVVDDETAVSIILQHFITQEHLPIQITGTAADGQAGLELIRSLRPQLVFLDIQMPRMNGFEVMRAAPEPAYIIITAYEYFQYAQQAIRLGAKDILLKPLEINQLHQAVSRAVGWNITASPLVNDVLEYLHAHYAEKINLDQLSQLFFVTPSHLSRAFKKYTGESLVPYINQVRMEKARQLLREGRCSVKEVAEQTGYESLNNFYKYFKQSTGITPNAFMKEREAPLPDVEA